jgi:hypothetical protein
MAVLLTRRVLEARPAVKRMRHLGREFVTFYREALIPHFRHEEEWLLPRLPAADSTSERLVERTLLDHVTLHRLVLFLERAGAGDRELDRSLRILCDALESHIRFEERELFPHVERSLPGTDLDELGLQLQESESADVHIPGSDPAGGASG